MKKHDIVEGVIDTYEFPNKGSFHMDDRKVTVKGAIKGQKVSCRITKLKKGKADGRLLEVLEKSELAGLQAGDTIFFIADKEDKAAFFAGQIRNELGARLDLIEKNAYRFCYVNDFPMFERDPETKKIGFTHNPFSMPQGGLEALNTMDPLDILAYQYDIVCNDRTRTNFREPGAAAEKLPDKWCPSRRVL